MSQTIESIDTNPLTAELNEPQCAAVTAPLTNLLILAGAGSGKTRVLVQRIAWLLQQQACSVHSILAVTFTNKAANEMRRRIEQLVSYPTAGMWVGTFHRIALRLLRTHWQDSGLPENFQIMDSDDQLRLIKRILKALNLDEDKWSPRHAQQFINTQKDQGLRSQHLKIQDDIYLKTMFMVYSEYERACNTMGLVDFAELLLRAHELWLQHPEILNHYQQRFRYVLVDEFQDTNTIQYAWIKLLLKDAPNYVMAVGDDDQSIYGWRGAQIENIRRFSQDFAAQTIRLEQNYRSTGTILGAANGLIGRNQGRLGKDLWTAGDNGEPISIYAGFNEVDEARFIVNRMIAWQEQGNVYRDVAVLYRSNAQSRVLEEALLQAGVPYRVYGGLRFFERAEIKDALSYLRLLVNPHDDPAFERVVNTPTRGIGLRTVETLRVLAKQQQQSLWQAAEYVLEHKQLAARANNALSAFLDLIRQLATDIQQRALAEQVNHVIHHSGLWAHYQNSKQERSQSRLENLQELVTAAKQFVVDDYQESAGLAQFLAHAVLEAGEMQEEEHQDFVQLMTLHSAKGLEFPLVFIAGVEEGLFPHRMSIEDPNRLEEERRLCYVGMTRAMRKLYLSYAELRREHGKEHYRRPSRFLREVPEQFLEEVRSQHQPVRAMVLPVSNQKNNRLEGAEFELGQTVFHQKFGEGTVLNYEGSGKHLRIQVNFTQHGSKWLVMAYANLVPSMKDGLS